MHLGDIQVIIGIISKLSLLGIVDKALAFNFHNLVGEIYLPSLNKWLFEPREGKDEVFKQEIRYCISDISFTIWRMI